MAQDFDQFPFEDELVKKGTQDMSATWISSMSTFFQSLIGYLSQNGIFVPKLTDAQRLEIQSPEEGQMIYNTTTVAPMIYQGGVWKTFTTS